MSLPSSYTRVAYDLRPAKQVERRMILDAFLKLQIGGFDLRTYHYYGFGSIYFVDFILFHKLLGINKLTSIEGDLGAESRIKYNVPFNIINVEMEMSYNVIPKIREDERIIFWLDYDTKINSSILEDIANASSKMCSGSVLLATIDARQAVEDPQRNYMMLKDEIGDYIPYGASQRDFVKSNYFNTLARILFNSGLQGIAGYPDKSLMPLFKIFYKDSCPMITIGYMICDSADKRRLKKIDFAECPFVVKKMEDSLYDIHVPKLTRKERSYLDSHMPRKGKWRPGEFHLAEEDLDAYNKIYRFNPSYAELFY
ncbi:MAG: hypothetical protein KDC90_07590 [Ignavibacteriae bacterium]|nr:hypothetical protein [Ignavibacteriota bacterium]